RFKERPPLDSVSNGILFFLVFLIGFSFGGSIYEIPLKIYLVGVCVMGIHSFSTIMDYSIDKMAGHKTFAVVFGKRTAALFASAVFLLTYFFAKIGSMVINFYLNFCILLFFLSFILSSEKLASFIFKLIFVGFILTAVSFLITYPG
ncbi:MAG: UbiA family prenyltransferase, partial [Thermodesulfobacteriota bacterium]